MNNFIILESLEIKERLPGAAASYFQTGYSTFAYTELVPGAEIPLHNHMQEAVDIILEGELEMEIDGKTDILKQGMISFIPSYIYHKAKAISNCKVITVLHPKRFHNNQQPG